jgi:hypothetical protein
MTPTVVATTKTAVRLSGETKPSTWLSSSLKAREATSPSVSRAPPLPRVTRRTTTFVCSGVDRSIASTATVVPSPATVPRRTFGSGAAVAGVRAGSAAASRASSFSKSAAAFGSTPPSTIESKIFVPRAGSSAV